MVKREKFLEDAKADPARFYRSPNDILRDRRLTDDHRREILAAWERKLRDDSPESAQDLIAQVHAALQELDGDRDARIARSSGR